MPAYGLKHRTADGIDQSKTVVIPYGGWRGYTAVGVLQVTPALKSARRGTNGGCYSSFQTSSVFLQYEMKSSTSEVKNTFSIV